MNELSAIKDFVMSLESTKLTGEQQAILLVGKSDYLGGIDAKDCTNNGCTNSKPDCDKAVNSSCVNEANCKCPDTNTSSCSSNTSGCTTVTNPTNCVVNSSSCVNNCSSTKGIGFGTMGFPGFDI